MDNEDNYRNPTTKTTLLIPSTVFQITMVATFKANFMKRRRSELWENKSIIEEEMPKNVGNCITKNPQKAISTTVTATRASIIRKLLQENEEKVKELIKSENDKNDGKSVCLLCRQVFLEEYCWHCNKNFNKRAATAKTTTARQQQQQQKQTESLLVEKKVLLDATKITRHDDIKFYLKNIIHYCNDDVLSASRKQKEWKQQKRQILLLQAQQQQRCTCTCIKSQRYLCQDNSIDEPLILSYTHCCSHVSSPTNQHYALMLRSITKTIRFDGENALALIINSLNQISTSPTLTLAIAATEQQQQHVHSNINPLTTGTNNKIDNQIFNIKQTTIAAAETTTTTTTTTINTTKNSANKYLEITNNNNNHNNNTNKKSKRTQQMCIRMARNALRTFQFLVFYILHLQLLQCPLLNSNNNYNNNNNKTNSNNNHKNSLSLKNLNSENNSVQNKINIFQSNKRQQRPPKQRLNLHHLQQQQQQQQQHTSIVGYYNNLINSSFLNINTSQKSQKQQQEKLQHHNVQMQQKEQQQTNYYHRHYNKRDHRLHCQQQKKTQLHNLKMPNLSLLYKILIALSFLSIFLPSTTQAQQPIPQLSLPPFSGSSSLTVASPVLTPSSSLSSLSSLGLSSKTATPSAGSTTTTSKTSQVRLARNETVCKSLDLRNAPSEFRQLENCTVIEGFLLMSLVNTHVEGEFTESYPLLTEVTEFIIVFRVHNLRSLSQIFPNLSVIRGGILHEGYALVVYSNPHLEDLGLSKLTTISRGGVRIENNLNLCYVETIDWSLIVTNTTDIVIQNNRASIECPLCPDEPKAVRQDADGTVEGDAICKEYHGKRHCWNSKICQKICPERCPNNCVDEKTCCNDACLSGCSANNLNVCTSCRHFSIYNSTCIDECPPNYYNYLDRRCLTAEACSRMGTKYENNKQETLVAFNGTCSTRCPNGYIKEGLKCVACGNKCTKKCEGGLIDSVSAAKGLHGCTHIVKEGLTISIKRGGRHLMEDLEFGLSAIQVIDSYLKVHLTYGMFSLEFFKNLHTIKGEVLCEDKFALYILENNDLEKLWGTNQTVQIDNGRVFFHFNPKLCYSTIDALRASMHNSTAFDKNEVATDSNGYKGSCNPEYLNTTVLSTSASSSRILIVNPLKFDDDRTFIGYQYFYMEDRYKNATKHQHRPCDDSWFVSEPTKEIDFIISGLTPFTQYAYYIKTMTISAEPRNAQSPIQYFKTKSSQPNSVRKLEAYANSSSEIILSWLPPAHVYGNLAKYKIRARLDIRSQKSASRNYCKDPVKGTSKFETGPISKPATEKPMEQSDCNCYDNRDKDRDSYESEADEANRHDIIDFENTLQNFIYVKHPNSSNVKKDDSMETDEKRRVRRSYDTDDTYGGDSFLMRHIRSLPTRRLNTLGNISTTTIKPIENTTSLFYNATRMDSENKYYEVVIDSVNASITSYVFTQLKHFSVYMLEVEACREHENGAKDKECSEVLSTYVRTLKMDNVDKVENLRATLEKSNTTRTNVRLRWDPPERPNGAIVSYTILYTMQAKDAVEEKKCITEQDYRNKTNGYTLTGLQMGSNYSIQVRANSLADEGVVSEPIFIQTPNPTMPLWLIILIIVLCLIIVGIGAFIWYCFYKKKKNAPPSDLRFYPSVNPYYMSLQYVPDSWEVARERVIQLSPLGQGSFGMVYEGILKGLNSSTEDTPCAIKTVNENATDRERLNFLNEAGVMKQFDTFHVVKLLGVCSIGQPALVVMELMKNGDLKSYLRAHRPYDREDDLGTTATTTVVRDTMSSVQPPPISRIYQMAIEIADGMAYLAAKKFVHRDLAARNCMVAADLTVKIGDFGMTRDIYETDYYRKGTKGLLPVRWMPPEALRDGIYSSASDVFSYGVVLWEMATLASQPYQGLSNDQVLRYVIDGGVMERPENCPDDLYDLMQRCWMHRPSARPTFMDIITYLIEYANDEFAQVSFFHTEVGQQVLAKERAELQHSGDVFHDHENDLDDATTPLRMGEYNDFALTMDNNSSVENHGDSPIVVEDPTHSPYSIGSANIVSSTPDGQSKHSLTTTQNQPILNSAPSTSATVIGSVGSAQPHSYPRQILTRYQSNNRHPIAMSAEDNAPYVQPDQLQSIGVEPTTTTTTTTTIDETKNSNTNNAPTSRSSEKDERGYEMYDPSPNFREHPTYHPADDDDNDDDDEEDFDGILTSKLSGGQNLLPRQKIGSNKPKMPIIMPISSSVPDEVISAPMSSSAASSNASSNATATAGSVGGAKYPTGLKLVAETVQNVGNSLVPTRLRKMNQRLFGHKRTGSNTSHKSTSSNPASTNSNTNLTTTTGQQSSEKDSQNLGNIESGSAWPRFFTPTSSSSTPPQQPSSSSGAIISDNPNYTILDETANASMISSAEASTTPAHKNNVAKPTSTIGGSNRPTGFITSTNPNYQLLDESLNTTGTPTQLVFSSLSANPNYASHAPPQPTTTTTTAAATNTGGSNTTTPYVMMNEPTTETRTTTAPKFSDNPNYQMMGPTNETTATTTQTPAFSYLWRGPPSSEDDDNDDGEDDNAHTEHIKMERMPLSRRATQKHQQQQQPQQQQQQQSKKRGSSRSRSRSKSSTKSGEQRSTSTATPPATLPVTTTTVQTKPSQTFSLKEKWLRQQQQPPPPPPNGFIGRDG